MPLEPWVFWRCNVRCNYSGRRLVWCAFLTRAPLISGFTDPKKAPLIPRAVIGVLARFSFNIFTLSLIYGTIAKSVTVATLSEYWFVIVGMMAALAISYGTATILHYSNPYLRVPNHADFVALRVSATFPNVVALPILIFPALCENRVVFEAFGTDHTGQNTTENDLDSDTQQIQLCTDQANTMIFIGFFVWSMAFFGIGHVQLIKAATSAINRNTASISLPAEQHIFDPDEANSPSTGVQTATIQVNSGENLLGDRGSRSSPSTGDEPDSALPEGQATTPLNDSIVIHDEQACPAISEPPSAAVSTNSKVLPRLSNLGRWLASLTLVQALRQVLTSPGFIALILGFITACIPPLRSALFDPGGALRFLGSAVETLGVASTSTGTIVVAASLVPAHWIATVAADHPVDLEERVPSARSHENSLSLHQEPKSDAPEVNLGRHRRLATTEPLTRTSGPIHDDFEVPDSNPLFSDPNYGPFRDDIHSTDHHLRRRHRSALFRLSEAVREGSRRWNEKRRSSSLLQPRHEKVCHFRWEHLKVHVWFALSRLIVTPLLMTLCIVGLDCGSEILSDVPPLSKLVVIINATLPGALIVVVLLKANPSLSETADLVARVYLPSYLLSIVTITAWTAVGLWITIPDENGLSLCSR
jgi:predicted permease